MVSQTREAGDQRLARAEKTATEQQAKSQVGADVLQAVEQGDVVPQCLPVPGERADERPARQRSATTCDPPATAG